jgi:AraC-like DNA-binding protein
MRRTGAAGPDPVSEVLGRLEVRSSIFCLSELRAPWGFRVEGSALAKFHLVLEGAAWLRLDDRDPIPLRTGDLVMLPRGDAHAVSDQLRSVVTGLDRLIAEHPLEDGSRLRCGGSGALTQLLCGGFAVFGEGASPLLELVPDVLHVDGQSVAATTWLAPVLTAMEQEVAGGRPGASAIQTKIADVFVAQALRSWLVGAEQAGLLPAALLTDDGGIAFAIRDVENDLGARWTIDKLASNAGMSRTAFVTRFRSVVGDSPMRYVSRLRVSAAAGLLTTTRLSVHEVAVATGYESDASLSKAFKRQLGVPPGAYRAAAGQPAISIESQHSSA